MRKRITLLLILIPILLHSAVVNRYIKPGIKDIILGQTYKEVTSKLTKIYKCALGSNQVSIFDNFLSIKSFIDKYAPSIIELRERRNWTYNKFITFLNKIPYKNFIEPEKREVWLESLYPIKYKRWKCIRVMLIKFNPFVRRVDLAFYRNVLYYARFYIKDKYSFVDTYLPENERSFMLEIYNKYRNMYGRPILFNNYEYQWKDRNIELTLNGKKCSITFIDKALDKLVVRYLKNVSIVLSKIQIELASRANYIEQNLRDF